MVTKYMSDEQEVNEGDAGSHDFTTVQTLIKFPFTLHFAPDVWQVINRRFEKSLMSKIANS